MKEEKRIKILGITGPSGCGKDTAARYLSEKFPNKYHYVTLCTTRPKRNEEDNGYIFLDPALFLEQVLNGNMLNAQEFRGWYYGLNNQGLNPNKINLLPMNNEMIMQMTEENRKDYILKILYINTNPKERLLHILNREESPDCYEICRRFVSDDYDYEDNHYLHNLCEYEIINNYAPFFFSTLKRNAEACFEGD